MEYDTGSTTMFKITYLGSREFEKGNGMHYPYIIDGKGYGMIDDITDGKLKKIVEDIDKKGKSDYYVLEMDGRHSKIYDYRNFDLSKNNLHMRRYFYKIKYSLSVVRRYEIINMGNLQCRKNYNWKRISKKN